MPGISNARDRPTDKQKQTQAQREKLYTERHTEKGKEVEIDRWRDDSQSLYGEVELSAKLSTHTTVFAVNYVKKLRFFFFSVRIVGVLTSVTFVTLGKDI
jgi:hypothetical protein